jgi:pantoate--beta-alanine ligase
VRRTTQLSEPLRQPAQFGDEADLARYPRDEGRDLDIAREAGVDLVFAPSTDEMYPPDSRPGST